VVSASRSRTPKAMLLVDHGQRQRLEHHVVLDQRMGADQQIDLAGSQPRQIFAPLLALFAAGEDRDRSRRVRPAARWS
jgi:hypothetical protein